MASDSQGPPLLPQPQPLVVGPTLMATTVTAATLLRLPAITSIVVGLGTTTRRTTSIQPSTKYFRSSKRFAEWSLDKESQNGVEHGEIRQFLNIQ